MRQPLSIPIPESRLDVRPDSMGLARGGADASSVRQFSADVSLWAGLRERFTALGEDLRVPEQRQALVTTVLLTALVMFSYWPGLLNAKAAWNNAQYSHGWLVPLFSVAILFWWRQPISPVAVSARIAGLALLVASYALRLTMAKYRIITIDMYTFVPAVAGVVLLGGGWSMFRWAAAPVAFLIFMYPLPDEATRYLLGPLQTLATAVSAYSIQTLGVDAIREGNRIIVGERHLGVVDACSGLRMLTIFIALSFAIVMLGEHDWIDSIMIVASATPIALFVNAVRITLTGVMYTIDAELADKLFHDWAGYFMMPMALALLFLEQWLLAWIRVPVQEEAPPSLIAPPAVVPGRSGWWGRRWLAVGRPAAADVVPVARIGGVRVAAAGGGGSRHAVAPLVAMPSPASSRVVVQPVQPPLPSVARSVGAARTVEINTNAQGIAIHAGKAG